MNFASGVTVQVLAQHPFSPTSFLWVHNVLEDAHTDIAMYAGQAKPPGWGNGGGGLEPNELEILADADPGHLILHEKGFSDEYRQILACGLREFTHESGYQDIEFVTDTDDGYLLDYQYHNGHRVVTIWGEVKTFRVGSIVESNEIDLVDWFDMAIPLPKLFFNRLSHPGRPYWSHVRRTIIGASRIDRYVRDTTDHFSKLQSIGVNIHPSWRLVFPVGKRDPRFPAGGYRLSPPQWYELFDTMVEERMEMVDDDFLYRMFRNQIDAAKRQEESGQEKTTEFPTSGRCPTPGTEAAVPDSDGSSQDELPVTPDEDAAMRRQLKEIIRSEDEEYRIWIERELGIEQEPAN